MRVAHLSDLHLGFRAFPRRERGGNLRERDLAAAFHRAVNEVGRLRPDLVLLAGDLFHDPDPPATAFLALTRGIQRLQELLPGIPVLAVAGGSDTPMAPGDPGPVAVLDAVPGVEAAAGAPRAVHLGALDAHVLLVPHRAVVRPPYPELRPDPGARWNLLLLRGHPVDGAPRGGGHGMEEGGTGGPLVVDPAGWDYVALGGGHEVRAWGARVHTAGSLERVGVDPWRESAVEKGFLLADLASGKVEFHPVPGRPVVDLAPVRTDPDGPEAGTRRLRELLEGLPGGADGKLLRVRLRGMEAVPTQGVSPGLLAGVRRRAAHLELLMEPGGRPPEPPSDPPGPSKRGETVPGTPHLRWTLGGERWGEVALPPGLWTLTADSPADLERVARSLGGKGTDPRIAFHLEGEALAPRGPRARRSKASPPNVPSPEEPPSQEPPPEEPPSQEPPSPAPPSTGMGTDRTSSSPEAVTRRADWIEAAGDAEARALEWARERQDADSRLTAYRERARELRERIRELREGGPSAACPTCQRPLGAAHPGLLTLLEEEWEEVVQDGSWWKRRRAQLEEKPADLLVLERRALELQAALEAGEAGAGVRLRPPPPGTTPEAGPGAAVTPPPGTDPNPVPDHESALVAGTGCSHGLLPHTLQSPDAPDTPDTLRRMGVLLHRATEGRLDGVLAGEEGSLLLVEADGHARLPTRAEGGLLALVREGAAGWAREEDGGSGGPGVQVLRAGRAGVPPEAVSRILETLLAATPRTAWLALVPPEVAGILPHRRQGTLQVVRDEEDRLRVRRLPGGRGRVVLRLPPG